MEALCSYLPASILSFLLEQGGKAIAPPTRQSYKTAVLFADISGYTALCEAVASKGVAGDEYLARHLNSYFEQLVRIMSSQGGDVFKFAGDAVIVLWPPSPTASAEEIEDLTLVARRAAQCGLEIKRGLQDVNLAPGITLSVKIGVGVGEVSILHVGGVFGRMEYVATGAPLLQAFGAEHHCKVPDVVVSPEAWKLISPHFEAEINDGHAYLKKNVAPLKKVNVSRAISHAMAMAGGAAGSGSIRSVDSSVRTEVLRQVGKYVPSAVIPFINHHEEKWASELRRICVLFVNLGMREEDMNAIATNKDYIKVIHEVLSAVQTAVYKYEGSLNKFLMDDKGSTLIAVFGLPPLAHEDDSIRGVLAALAICAKLHELGFKPAIGVTTGTAFCGVVGSHSRREYSVLGDTVNLAARLMQHATKLGGGVICDTATQYSARHRLHFEDLAQIQVKGKVHPVLIWQPYSRVLAPLYQSTEFLQQQAAEALAAQQAAEPSSPSSTIAPIPILTELNGSNSLSPTSAALLQNTSMVLVDDETLHLRRKSMTVDPITLMRSVSATSPTAASASAAAAGMPSVAPLDLGTSDTIDAAAVASLDRVAENGGAVARAVDSNTQQELAREGEMIPASAAAASASSATAGSNGSDLPDFSRYATALNGSSGSGGSSGSAAAASMLSLPAANTPLDLMRQIHDFQMEGHRRSYMQERRLKRRGGAHAALQGSSASSSAAVSPVPAAERRVPSGSARTNSMDAAVHTTSPTFASVSHANSLQLNLAAAAADSAASSAADVLALGSTSNVHLRWFSTAVCFDNISEGLAPSLEDVAAHFPSRLDSRRVRGVRVLLPDGLGCLHLSTAHLESILQLKEEISILCRKRMLLPLSACSQDYFLALEDDALWEALIAEEAAASAAGNDQQAEDEEFAIELDAPNASIEDLLGPLVERQKAALTAYRAVHTHRPRGAGASSGIASSPVSRSQLASSPPASPGRATAAFSHPSSPASRLPSLDSALQPLQSDLLTLCLCAARPDYLVDVLPRKFHDIILHALEVRLLRERRGGTILLEGSVGLGKTHLMQGALAAAQRNHGEGVFTVLNTVANPFEMNKPLSAWRDIFLTAMDLEIERQPQPRSSTDSAAAAANGASRPSSQSRLRAQRRSFLESKLKLRRSFGRDGLDLLAPVLNEVLQLDFPETVLTRGLDAHARTMHAQNLLVVLMQLFTGCSSSSSGSGSLGGLGSAASTPRVRGSSGAHLPSGSSSSNISSGPCIVVCIDDAVFLDIQSWALVLRMSREVPGLLLILATRPMNKTYQAAFVTSGVPADFVALRSEPQTTVLTLKSRTDQVIIQIAQEAFADQSLPPSAAAAAAGATHKHQPSRSLIAGATHEDASIFASPSSSSTVSASGSSALSLHLTPAFAMINCPPSGRVLPELPQGLVNLLLKKAHGSPLVVLELVYNLKKSQLCTVEWIENDGEATDGSQDTAAQQSPSRIVSAIVRIDPRFNVSLIHNNPLVAVPITLQNILGCRIDRLTHTQRMILKCGAIVGDRFEFRLIEKIYPLATSEEVSLRHEMQGLIQLNILKEVIIKRSNSSSGGGGGASGGATNGVAASPSHSKSRTDALAPTVLRSSASGSSLSMLLPSPVHGVDSDSHFPAVAYSWTDGFMREMFLSRMLDNQKSALDEKVSEARLELFKKRSERVLKMLLSPKSSTIVTPLNPILSSVLYVRETPVVKKTRSVHDDAGDASKSKDASGSPSALGSPQPPALEYHLRYFVLTDGLLLGWVTEDAFLSARDPVCCYSLEEAATCENTTASFSFPNPAPPGLDPQLAFVIRSAVCMDRFSVYTHHAPTLVYLAALNEKEYEEWGVRLHEQITEKLMLPPVEGGPVVGGATDASASQTGGAGAALQSAPNQAAEDADATSASNAALNAASGGPSGLHSQRTSLNQPNPLAPSSSSAGGGGGVGVASHTPPNNNSPHTSFSIPATPGGSSMFGQSQDVATLSASDRDAIAAKFVAAVENRAAPQIMPPALMSVRKHRAPTASDSKDSKTDKGSLFSSEWKQRYVTLIDEALLLRDKKVGTGYKWTRPTQAFALGIGSPAAFLAPRAADVYDPIKKLYKITVEADVWIKGGVVSWSRRSVILGCATMDQARQLSDQIRQVIFKNQVANTQLQKQKHSRASTWGNFKAGGGGGQQQMQGQGAGRKNEAGGPTASSPAATQGGSRGLLNGGANGPPNTPGRGMTRASFSTTSSPSPQHHQRTLNKSHSHAHFGASSSGTVAAEDPDRKLRASQRQMNGGMSIVTQTNSNGPTAVSSANAAPPTPSAAGASSPSVPAPADQLGAESGSSAQKPPVHHLSAPPTAGQHSPMTSPTQPHHQLLYPGSPLGGLGSPLYPTSPSPTAGSASHSRGVGSGEEFTSMASPSPGAIVDEDRQIDALFNEAIINLDGSGGSGGGSSNGGLASPGLSSPSFTQSDQLKTLLLQLRHKVKAVTRASRARSRLAGSVGDSPHSSPPRADVAQQVQGAAASSSPGVEVDDTESGEFGFTEMVSAADIDDTTRSWLQLNYSKPEEIADAAEAEAAAAQEADSDSLPHSTPSTAVTVSVTSPSHSRGSKIILQYAPAGLVVDVVDLGSWEWCIFDVAPNDGSELLPVVAAIFGYFDFQSHYSIPPQVFAAWAHQVFCEYFENPYHNFYHAVDVLQTTFALLTSQRGGQYLTLLEKFALLIAALCHDVRHPGLNNLFHISARTPLALLYNDQSILEHHHAASTFRILERPECNLLSNLSLSEYKHVRARITLGILATCMTDHFDGIQKFNAFLESQAKLPANVAQAQAASSLLSVSPTSAAASSAAAAAANWTPVFQSASDLSDSARCVIFNSFLHAADIANQTKPWRTQRQWSDAVLTEFLNQGDMERAKGLPVSPNCDRGHTDQALLSLNFVDFIVAPLFLSLRNLLPSLQWACLQMKDNRVEWSRLFVQSVQANTALSEAEKAAEIARANRRMESFAEIMLPQDEAFRRLSSNAEEPNGTAAATSAGAATTSAASSTGTAGGAAGGKRASVGPASNPGLASSSSSALSVDSAAGTASAASPGAAASSSPVSSGGSGVSAWSAPASSSSSAAAAAAAPRRAHPLNDPRRNSMLMLRKFVSANSKTTATSKPRYHTLGPQAFSNSSSSSAQPPAQSAAAPAANQSSAPAPLIRHYSVTSAHAAAGLTEHRS